VTAVGPGAGVAAAASADSPAVEGSGAAAVAAATKSGPQSSMCHNSVFAFYICFFLAAKF